MIWQSIPHYLDALSLIHYLIAADKMSEEEIADIQREYNIAHGKDINVDELLPLPKPIAEIFPTAIGA